MGDQLINVLQSYRTLFWQDNKSHPDSEIQKLWNDQLAYLTTKVGANPSGTDQPAVPNKRPVPSTSSFVGPRPSKRRDLVCSLHRFSYVLV